MPAAISCASSGGVAGCRVLPTAAGGYQHELSGLLRPPHRNMSDISISRHFRKHEEWSRSAVTSGLFPRPTTCSSDLCKSGRSDCWCWLRWPCLCPTTERYRLRNSLPPSSDGRRTASGSGRVGPIERLIRSVRNRLRALSQGSLPKSEPSRAANTRIARSGMDAYRETHGMEPARAAHHRMKRPVPGLMRIASAATAIEPPGSFYLCEYRIGRARADTHERALQLPHSMNFTIPSICWAR